MGKISAHCKVSYRDFCRELCQNGWTGRFAVRIVDSGGPKEAQVQSYSPGGANVPLIPINRPCAAAMQPYVKLLRPLVMVALCNRADHYIFILFLLLLSSSFFSSPYVIGQTIIFSSCFFFFLLLFFPRLISAVGNWMFTILWHMVWP